MTGEITVASEEQSAGIEYNPEVLGRCDARDGRGDRAVAPLLSRCAAELPTGGCSIYDQNVGNSARAANARFFSLYWQFRRSAR